MSITLVFPQKGKQAPEPILRDVFKRKVCMRKGMNDFFSLSDPFIDYTVSRDVVNCNDCSLNEGQWCQCSLCCCCSVSPELKLVPIDHALSYQKENFQQTYAFGDVKKPCWTKWQNAYKGQRRRKVTT